MMDLYQVIADYQKKGVDMVLVTAVFKEGEGPVDVGKKMLVTETGAFFGTVGGGALEHLAQKKSLELIKKREHLYERYALSQGKIIENAKTLPMICGGVVTFFYEFIGVKNYVTIFGAGHVAQALVKVLKPLSFGIHVVDERENVIKQFQGADQVYHMKFADYIDQYSIKDNSFVVVCTPSHRYDYHVINKIIEHKLKPKYIGMLCSKEKLKDYLDKTYETYGKDTDLSHFYSPIGLDLGGGSVEEIAVSISAEILSLHHGKKGHKHMRAIDDYHHHRKD